MSRKFALALTRNLKRVVNVLEHPLLLETIGNSVNRDFVKDLLYVKRRLQLTPKTVLDVGAANGEYSAAVRFVFPNATLYAFEPIEKSFAELQRRFAGCSHVHLMKYALAHVSGERDFQLNGFSFSSSLLPMTERHKLIFPQTQDEQRVVVQCRRLDEVSEVKIENPSYVKIDVQGAELDVLKGAGDIVEQFSAVQLELNFEEFYLGQPNYSEIMAFMFARGFRRFIQLDPVFRPRVGLTHSDVLFFR